MQQVWFPAGGIFSADYVCLFVCLCLFVCWTKVLLCPSKFHLKVHQTERTFPPSGKPTLLILKNFGAVAFVITMTFCIIGLFILAVFCKCVRCIYSFLHYCVLFFSFYCQCVRHTYLPMLKHVCYCNVVLRKRICYTQAIPQKCVCYNNLMVLPSLFPYTTVGFTLSSKVVWSELK